MSEDRSIAVDEKAVGLRNVYAKLRSMSETAASPHPNQMKLVLQEHPDGCGIACAAMIVGVSFREAWERLAPPPTKAESASAYQNRELPFLQEKGWWPSAQLLLKTVIGLEELDSIVESEERFKLVVESSQRLRLVMAFADGAKPDHTVIWDNSHREVIFDPSRGEMPLSELFHNAGLQTYSGTLGFTAFCYQPGQPIQTLIKTEEGFVPPVTSLT